MAVGEFYKLTAIWRQATDAPAAVNEFLFEQLDALIFDTAGEDLVDAFRSTCEVAYLACVTGSIALVEYKVAKAPLFLTEYIDDAVEIAGSLTGDPLPARIAGLINKRSADLSRRGRGRTFLPPANEAANTAGAPTVGYVATMQAFADAMMIDMPALSITNSGWRPALWSEADQVAKAVTQMTAKGRWSSQADRENLF